MTTTCSFWMHAKISARVAATGSSARFAASAW